jgi:4-hydroxy-tetrahydrodipicolinate synthase
MSVSCAAIPAMERSGSSTRRNTFMASQTLGGVIAAIATPVDASGAPDRDRYLRLARFLLDNGCDGLNVLGTTGEATSFTAEQRMGLMSAIAEAGLPLDRLMVGTGAAAVGDAVRITRHAAELGFAGALVLPPFYYKGVSADGVLRYLEAVVRGSATPAIPIYLYHFPALSGVPYDLDLLRQIVDAFGERIVGLKDSSGDLPYARAAAAVKPGFRVFPSTEAALLEARTGVFAGCISATANLNADLCGRAFHQGDEGAHKTAVAIRGLFDGLPLVPGIKALLAHIHRDAGLAATLPPLAPFPADTAQAVIAKYDSLRQRAGELQPA